MYLLDTNVISELRKARKTHQNVRKWAERLPSASLYISVISVLELEIGILLIERSATKSKARSFVRGWIVTCCPHSPAVSLRLIPPSPSDARRFTYPNPRSDRDALIAATALVHGLTVATRNVADFERTGVGVLNPWEA
jgi:toxin FitB